MKKIIGILSIVSLLVLNACSSTYERDKAAGEVVKLTVVQMQEKIAEKETFPIVFTQTTCSYCVKLKTMLDTYLVDHKVTLYDVVLDATTQAEREANLDIIKKTFPDLSGTPTLYYVKDGKLNNTFNKEESITEENFDKWVQKLKLDQKK